MWLAPDAQPDDGLFDVVLIGDVTKRDFVTTAPKIYKGTLPRPSEGRAPAVARGVASTRPSALPIELDGEQVGTTPVRFEIVPAAIRVRVPA